MTDHDLRDLLHERVAHETMPDLSGPAWQGGLRVRRRRRVGAVAGAVALTAAVSVGVAGVDSSAPGPDQRPGGQVPTTPSREATREADTGSREPDPGSREPDARYAGIGVWWSPEVAEEVGLPWYDGDTAATLPRTVDLSAGAPGATDVELALAVFAVFGGDELARVVVLAPDGTTRSLDVSRLDPVRDEFGNAAALLPANGGLAPGGSHVFFTQNSSLELYEFAAGTWRTIDVPDWLAEGARWLDDQTLWVPTELGGSEGRTYGLDGQPLGRAVVDMTSARGTQAASAYGPEKALGATVAQTYRLDGPVAPLPDERSISNPEALVVTEGERRLALAFPDPGRSKGCCPVAGWLEDGTVAFESGGRLLAWRVGTPEVQRVSTISGWELGAEWYVASWALPAG